MNDLVSRVCLLKDPHLTHVAASLIQLVANSAEAHDGAGVT